MQKESSSPTSVVYILLIHAVADASSFVAGVGCVDKGLKGCFRYSTPLTILKKYLGQSN